MTHIITSLCLRDNGCSDVCPVESINAGAPVEEFPTYYIDASTCIDCGACVPECPFHAIYPEDEVPAAYKAIGGELINEVGLTGEYNGKSHHGEAVALSTTRALATGEVVDLRKAIQENRRFYS